MLQIAYTSVAAQSLASGDIFRIIESSARNNNVADLTGFLIYSNGEFLQVIEGPVANVDKLINTLKTDERHHSIKIAYHSRIAERSFPNWGMKRIHVEDATPPFETVLSELGNAPVKVRQAAEKFLGLAPA